MFAIWALGKFILKFPAVGMKKEEGDGKERKGRKRYIKGKKEDQRKRIRDPYQAYINVFAIWALVKFSEISCSRYETEREKTAKEKKRKDWTKWEKWKEGGRRREVRKGKKKGRRERNRKKERKGRKENKERIEKEKNGSSGSFCGLFFGSLFFGSLFFLLFLFFLLLQNPAVSLFFFFLFS